MNLALALVFNTKRMHIQCFGVSCVGSLCYNKNVMDITGLSLIIFVAFLFMLGAFLFPVLFRLNRILGRVDEISADLVHPMKHLAKALAVLKESAITAGIAYFMKKVNEFKQESEEETHHSKIHHKE